MGEEQAGSGTVMGVRLIARFICCPTGEEGLLDGVLRTALIS